jgi:hypothetical protein
MENISVKSTPKVHLRVSPEWGDANRVEAVFGWSRSFTLQRWQEGQIESALVRGRGTSRGKRLFSFASIRKLIASQQSAAQEVTKC